MSGRDRNRSIDMGPDKTDSDWRARPCADTDEGPRRDDAYGEREQYQFTKQLNFVSVLHHCSVVLQSQIFLLRIIVAIIMEITLPVFFAAQTAFYVSEFQDPEIAMTQTGTAMVHVETTIALTVAETDTENATMTVIAETTIEVGRHCISW